jgi:hypothetical protein
LVSGHRSFEEHFRVARQIDIQLQPLVLPHPSQT